MWKMAVVCSETEGQDLENWPAQSHQKFPSVPPKITVFHGSSKLQKEILLVLLKIPVIELLK